LDEFFFIMEKIYFGNLIWKFPKNIFRKIKKSKSNFFNFEILKFEILKFWDFDFLIFRRIFFGNFSNHNFQNNFSPWWKNIFNPNFFDDLEFSYTFDLAHFEGSRRCTAISRRTTLTGWTGAGKSNFDEFSSIFKDFRWFLACSPTDFSKISTKKSQNFFEAAEKNNIFSSNNIFSKKIQSISTEPKHIQRGASNSLWASRTRPKTKNSTFFFLYLTYLVTSSPNQLLSVPEKKFWFCPT